MVSVPSRAMCRVMVVSWAARWWWYLQNKQQAVSGGGRDELVESFGGSIPCEGHAGASVEFDGDVVELLLAWFGEVGAFGEVLADEAVPVFVGAALPW